MVATAEATDTESVGASRSTGGWTFETSVRILQAVLDKTSMPYKVIDKGGDQGRIFASKTCPHHTDHDGDEFKCSVMQDGKFAANRFHDDAASWHNFKALIGWDENIKSVKSELGISHSEYVEELDGLVWLKQTKDGPVPVPLANFTARIARTAVEDDGEETRSTLHVEARLKQRAVSFRVPAQEFANMNWAVGRRKRSPCSIRPWRSGRGS